MDKTSELETALNGLEAALTVDFPAARPAALALLQKARQIVDGPRDPGTGKAHAELLRTEPWALAFELRRITKRLDSLTCALINTRAHLVDEGHPAFHILNTIEDAFVQEGEHLISITRVINPEGARVSECAEEVTNG